MVVPHKPSSIHRTTSDISATSATSHFSTDNESATQTERADTTDVIHAGFVIDVATWLLRAGSFLLPIFFLLKKALSSPTVIVNNIYQAPEPLSLEPMMMMEHGEGAVEVDHIKCAQCGHLFPEDETLDLWPAQKHWMRIYYSDPERPTINLCGEDCHKLYVNAQA